MCSKVKAGSLQISRCKIRGTTTETVLAPANSRREAMITGSEDNQAWGSSLVELNRKPATLMNFHRWAEARMSGRIGELE